MEIPKSPPDLQYSSLAIAAAVTPDHCHDGAKEEMLYTTSLRPDWCIGVVPHGGYLTTLLLNASTHYFTHSPHVSVLSQPHPIHSALTFVARCSIGAATVHVAPLKLGRQYSLVRVQLRQDGRLCIDATITHANMSTEHGATLATRAISDVPDRVLECEDIGEDPSSDFRMASTKLRCMYEKGSTFGGCARWGPSVREQWVQLNDGSGAGLELNSLGYLCDMFMPLPENYPKTQFLNWYPTLSLSLELKSLPPPGGWDWLFLRVESSTIRNGRMDLDIKICDEAGTIVAVSQHVAIIVDVARNSSTKAKVEPKARL